MGLVDRFYRQVGEMIRTERELAELTQDELAVQVGLTRTSITNIEKGRHRVQLHILYAIADELNISAFDLLPSVESGDLTAIEKLLPEDLLPEEREWVKSIVGIKKRPGISLGGKVRLLDPGLTPLDLLREAKVKEPPVPVEQVARCCGVKIRSVPFSGEIVGLAFRSGESLIVGVNLIQPKAKRRFTVAHELGHLVLHHNSTLHLDRHTTGYKVDKRAGWRNPVESEANEFASELLMPRQMLEKDLKGALVDYDDLGFVADLAARYDVSAGVMAARLITLGNRDL